MLLVATTSVEGSAWCGQDREFDRHMMCGLGIELGTKEFKLDMNTAIGCKLELY